MTTLTIDSVYKLVSDIEENKKEGEGSQNYEQFSQLLSATKGDALLRRLASQMVAKLFKYFPETMRREAFEAMVNMIEDEDVNIRSQVASDLPKLCKETPQFISKVSDILVQMLQTSDLKEQTLVNNALMQVLNVDSIAALRGIFGQILDKGVAGSARLRGIALLAKRLQQVQLPRLSQLFAEREVFEVMDDATHEEFVHCVQLLSALPCMQSANAKQKIIEKIYDEINYSETIEASDLVTIATVVECLMQVKTILSRDIRVDRFLSLLLQKTLPIIDSITSDFDGHNPRLDLLRAMADFACHSPSEITVTTNQLDSLFNYLNLLTLIPEHPDAYNEASSEETEAVDGNQCNFDFSEIECVLYIALSLISYCHVPKYSEHLSQVKQQLQYISLIADSYHKALSAYRAVESDSEEKLQLQELSMRQLTNISSICKELFRSQPSLNNTRLTLSWHPEPSSRKRKSQANGGSHVMSKRMHTVSDSHRRLQRRLWRR